MNIKKNEVLYFNIDFIEVYWRFYNIDLVLEWIDNDNSNSVQFWEFNLEKTSWLKNYEYKVSFKYWDTTVFAYYQWKKINNEITTRDYFTVYWSAFRKFDTEEVIEFINIYIVPDYINVRKRLNKLTLKRFDLALDIKRDIDKWILKYFKNLNQKWADYYWKNWKIETHYIWAYSIRDNKSFLIRIYNKKEDLQKKWIWFLYPQYLIEKNVTRIEIEFRVELTKNVDIDDLFNQEYLLNLMTIYLKKHSNIFINLKTFEVNKLKRLNKNVDINDLKFNQIVRDRYLSTFIWYAKKILDIWACPVDILLRNNIISDLTKEDIPYCIEKEDYIWKQKWCVQCAVKWDFNIKTYCEWITKRNNLHRLNNNPIKYKWE